MTQTAKTWDVITVGDLFTDLVMSGFRNWPEPGEEAFAKEARREIGGGAAITACGLSRLEQRVTVLSVIGADGDWLAQRLTECGVTAELLHRSRHDTTGVTVSVSTAKDRAYYTYSGANRELQPLLLTEPNVRRALTQARHVHLALPAQPGLLSTLPRALKQTGCTLSLDVGWHPDWLRKRAHLQALRELDMFMPNEREAELLTGQSEPEAMLRAFARAGVRGVALKLGERGSILLWEDEIYRCPPLDVKAVDTTGAGDCFNAGFIHAWLNGETPQRRLQFGNVCGALSTQKLGGIEGFPALRQLQTSLRKLPKM